MGIGEFFSRIFRKFGFGKKRPQSEDSPSRNFHQRQTSQPNDSRVKSARSTEVLAEVGHRERLSDVYQKDTPPSILKKARPKSVEFLDAKWAERQLSSEETSSRPTSEQISSTEVVTTVDEEEPKQVAVEPAETAALPTIEVVDHSDLNEMITVVAERVDLADEDDGDDSDGPILYTDSEGEEDEPIHKTGIAAKLNYKDTFANSLAAAEKKESQVGDCATEPSGSLETDQTNGFDFSNLPPGYQDSNADATGDDDTPQKKREKRKWKLFYKLSYRPTLEELRSCQVIKFNEYIEVVQVDNYDRRVATPWTKLTAKEKATIRRELNSFKGKMDVHPESKKFTRFHTEPGATE